MLIIWSVERSVRPSRTEVPEMLTITFFGKSIVVNNVVLARVILLLAIMLWLAMTGGVVYLLVTHWVIGIIACALYVGVIAGQLHSQIRQIRRSNSYYF